MAPNSMDQGVPDNLVQLIRKFASELDSWLRTALEDLPENLRAVKFDRKPSTVTLSSIRSAQSHCIRDH